MKLILDSEGLLRGLAGGALIGLSSSALLFATGETLGISGILGGMLRGQDLPPRHNSGMWRVAFISGLVSAGSILTIALSPSQMTTILGESVKLTALASLAGGFLVGIGTRLGSGCTSGHGVCGLPRGSPRSLLSVMTFMTFGAISAFFSRSAAGRSLLYTNVETPAVWSVAKSAVLPLLFGVSAISSLWSSTTQGEQQPTKPSAYFSSKRLVGEFFVYSCGLLMGLALSLSGMTDPNKVFRFLDFTGKEGFDPQLMMVMGGAVLVHGTTVQILTRFFPKTTPVLSTHLSSEKPSFEKIICLGLSPANTKIDLSLIAGSALFGLGWGLGGGCPGPLLVGGGTGMSQQISLTLSGAILGMVAYEVAVFTPQVKTSESKSN